MYTKVKQRKRFIHVASRETAVFTFTSVCDQWTSFAILKQILFLFLGHVKREHLHFLA